MQGKISILGAQRPAFKNRHDDIKKHASLLLSLYEEQDRELRKHINIVLEELRKKYKKEISDFLPPVVQLRVCLPFDSENESWTIDKLFTSSKPNKVYIWDYNKVWPLTGLQLQVLMWNGIDIHGKNSIYFKDENPCFEILPEESEEKLSCWKELYTLRKGNDFSVPVEIPKTMALKFSSQ